MPDNTKVNLNISD